MIVLSRNHAKVLDVVLRRARTDDYTYLDLGATRQENLPSGYRHDRVSTQVGHGDAAWSRAKDAIRLWKPHRHVGARITPQEASLDEGTTVLASFSAGPLLIIAPCRIVYQTDTPSRFGFAYGTLQGHPEQGEEALHVARGDDGAVIAEVTVFSRPADLATRLSGPFAIAAQRLVARRYVGGILEYVRAGG